MKKNKQKTDWELLPEMYRELVPKNCIDKMKKGYDINDSFDWSCQKIGFDFWSAIYEELNHIRCS